MVGDFNAHHHAWNCNKIDLNGENLLECINNHNLFLHNNKTTTYIKPNGYSSNIDLVFSSINISDKINVSAHDETWGSDHFPLFIQLSLKKKHIRKKVI